MAGWHERALLLGAGTILVCGAFVAFAGGAGAAPAALSATAAVAAAHGEVAAAVGELRVAADLPPDPGPDVAPVAREPVESQVVDDPRVARWVDDLRDDDIRWNGDRAYHALIELPPGRLPAVEAVLQSLDRQQQQFALGVLRVRVERGSPVGERFWPAAVAALRSDNHVRLPTLELPAKGMLRFLAQRTAAAVPALQRALGSDDTQQRFYSAYLLAVVGERGSAARVADELVRRLASNTTSGDALMATHALYRLGAAALPTLREWRPGLDDQGRALIDLIALDLASPPQNRGELVARGRLHDITGIYHDPAIEFDLGRSSIAYIGR